MTLAAARAAIRERLARLPRIQLALLPTPLEPLPRLSAALGGPKVYAKREIGRAHV